MWVGLRTNIFFCLALFHLLLLNSAWALSKHSTDSLHTLYEHEWRVAVSITMTRRKRASGQLFGSRECANIAIRYVTETNQHHHRYYLWYHCVAIQTCTSNTNGGISTVQGHRHDFQSGGFCDNCVRSTRKFFTLLCPEVINNPILYYSSIVQKFGGGGLKPTPLSTPLWQADYPHWKPGYERFVKYAQARGQLTLRQKRACAWNLNPQVT